VEVGENQKRDDHHDDLIANLAAFARELHFLALSVLLMTSVYQTGAENPRDSQDFSCVK
jgi:hypothetical protein